MPSASSDALVDAPTPAESDTVTPPGGILGSADEGPGAAPAGAAGSTDGPGPSAPVLAPPSLLQPAAPRRSRPSWP